MIGTVQDLNPNHPPQNPTDKSRKNALICNNPIFFGLEGSRLDRIKAEISAKSAIAAKTCGSPKYSIKYGFLWMYVGKRKRHGY